MGDIWKTKTIDLWNNKELRTNEAELVAIEPTRLVFRSKSSSRPGEVTTFYNSRDGNPCRTMRGADSPVCTGAFKFPAELGAKYEFKDLPFPNGLGKSESKCEVVAQEKVTVIAGTFDTTKIECNGFWQQVFEGSWNGRTAEVFWYAPKIHRTVKSIYKDYHSSGQLFTQNQTELTEYVTK